MALGERLKESRVNKGFSQGDVAEYLNISRQSISKWENNNSYPDLDNLVKLSTYYEVSIDELLKENQNLKKKIEINELEIEEPNKKIDSIWRNTEKDEGLILLILAFMGCLIAPFGLFVAPIVMKRNKKTNTLHKFVYFACACSLLVNAFVIYSITGDYLGWGTTTVEYLGE
ncbi:helix-turn-helix domain-containing protein [Carnobacterium inhibens]|uniref:Helix-turn-helix domain-containing protein n=1 Tax=Carnobacterium inhibens TaxID=147709 RepID=A0ABR7TCB9_9LACT|nr:helix-turn-helix transcriptional regulator [Carnobacterium inhibens]MBC9825620.1 helix-turn-helix domain-containing protein [Carnobacterium inhibens]